MVIDATVRYCNHLEHETDLDVFTHFHRHWELVYYRCDGISTINRRPYPVTKNSYVIIPAEVPHSEFSHPGIITCIGFDTDLRMDLFNRYFFDDPDYVIGALLDSVVAEVQYEPMHYSLRINLLLRDVLIQTLRQCSLPNQDSDGKMSMILNYLDAYCTTDVDFQALANSMNYSYDYLRHYFKERMHISLKRYVLQKRVQLAKEYLMSDTPVNRIAQSCGFTTAAHFTATFRQMTGMTPKEFREKAQKIVVDGNDPICLDNLTNE